MIPSQQSMMLDSALAFERLIKNPKSGKVSGGYLQTAQTWANTGVFFFIISESTTGYTFTPCVGSFTSPGIDTR